MVMTVKNFLELPITKDFKVETGHHDLERTMKNVEILDFEFMQEFNNLRDQMFTENSLVLTSLLFAKDDANLLFEMVSKLAELKVSALAYKPVIYEQLPEEVLQLAEKHRLPILKFGGDEFFEDIIFQAMDYRNKSSQTDFLESSITQLIENEMTEEQLQNIIRQMNKPFEKYMYAVCIQSDEKLEENLFHFEPFLRTGLLSYYKDKLIIVMTNNDENYPFHEKMHSLLQLFNWDLSKIHLGGSSICETADELAEALKEAYYASIFAKVYSEVACLYADLQSEQLLIQLVRQDRAFAEKFIEQSITSLETTEHLLETAISFILYEGNIKEMANNQFCHPNTVRYRLGKIKQIIAPNATDFKFYSSLSQVILLYLLLQYHPL